MKNIFFSNLIIFNNFSETRILATVSTRSSRNPLLKLKKKKGLGGYNNHQQ